MRRLVAELRRRKVVRTAVVYAALAWAAIEVVTTLLPVFGGRDTVVRIVVALILLGLPVAVVLSWMFDFTPEGFQRDSGEIARRDERRPGAVNSAATTVSRPPPAQGTPLVGRDEELTRLDEMLARGADRLVTITGTGGTGKTRLAIAVAEKVAPHFQDLAYVEIASVTDVGGVVPAIASAVGVKEAGERTLAEGLVTVIGERRVLLVLDNLEHVVEVAAALSGLLQRCPRLQLLATSRAPLRISGEVEVPLRPLSLPAPGTVPALEDLGTFAAIELFVDRTRRARPDFELNADNADAVLSLCRRLDGLPLALELAATRLRVLEPGALLEKLEHALDVLTAGARDLPERQRTLRATIDWSHSLLQEDERLLFRRLAVFAGGWSHESVEPVCGRGTSGRTLEALESLVEKGLVRRLDDGRFGMFETIREYALERLAESTEAEVLPRDHAEHFRSVVEALYAEVRGQGRGQVASLARGDAESANVEASLDYLHRSGGAASTDAVDKGLRMCGDLWMYWHVRGLHVRAREWSRRFLERSEGGAGSGARGRALVAQSVASLTLGDGPSCQAGLAEAKASLDEGDAEFRSVAYISSGVAYLTAGEMDAARQELEEGARIGREAGLVWERNLGLAFLGVVESATGNVARATSLFEEALARQREIGDHEGMGLSLGGQAALRAAVDRHDEALELYREAFEAYHAIGDRPEEARILDASAWTALAAGRGDEARAYFAESLRAYEEVGSVRGIGMSLVGLAATEAAEGRPERALRIAGAAASFSEEEGVANDYAVNSSAPRYLDVARSRVGEAEAERLEALGRALSVRDAVRYALTAHSVAEGPATVGDRA